jgi:hypothetical protein
MRKLFFTAALFAASFAFAADPGVDAQVEKGFNEAFPKAEKVTWYESEGNYEVLFTNNEVQCRLWYDREGNVTKTERYYTENGLSPFMLARLNKKFNGKKVFGVTEVTSESGITYHIVLEDGQKWYHVTSDASGNLHLEKKLLKA